MNKMFNVIILCSTIATIQPAMAGRFSIDYLNAKQVTALFSGKTVSGDDLIKGTPFTQYFNFDGTVINVTDGTKTTGTWRVNANGAHCVKWENEEEQCLHITTNEDGTHSKILSKNIKKIPVVRYKKFQFGNALAQTQTPNSDSAPQNPANTNNQLAVGELVQAVKDQDSLAGVNTANAQGEQNFQQLNAELFAAAKKNDLQKIEELIVAGANVNARDSKGNTPLIIAAEHQSLGAAQSLLHFGANPALSNNLGQTALFIAKSNQANQFVSVLEENNDGGSALGLFISINNRHISEEQFRRAAIKAFQDYNWHVDTADSNQVTGTYDRGNGRVFKSRMIYQPDMLLIKFDSGFGYPKPNYLQNLQTAFFAQFNH